MYLNESLPPASEDMASYFQSIAYYLQAMALSREGVYDVGDCGGLSGLDGL